MLISLSSLLILALDLVIIVGGKSLSSRVFVGLSFLASVWALSQSFLVSTDNPIVAEYLIRYQYVIGIIIAGGFIIFSKIYPHDVKPNRRLIYYLSGIASIISILYIFTDLLVTGVTYIGGYGKWSWQFGSLHPLFDIVFSILWIVALRNIYLNFKVNVGLDRLNSGFMFWGLTLGIIPPALANIILPTFGIYYLNWTGPIFSSIWIFVIGYSIMSYQQMNVRLVIIEIIAIAMSAMLFINIFIQAEIGRVENIILFVTFVTLSVTLIRTVISEVKGKQMLKALNDTLEQKVAEQTAEIRGALENERESRQELEKLNITKNQFVLITQHGIRSPIQNISNAFKTILGLVPKTKQKAIKSEIDNLKMSIDRLERINDDFVNVADSNTNDKILNLEMTDILSLVDMIFGEMSSVIKKKKIEVTINRNSKDWSSCNIDKNKIYNALLIVVENAIKYNTKSGKIIVDSKNENGYQKIEIIDTGIGISRDDLIKINSNHFYRGNEAKEINPFGMGIGFSVAKAIIEAHHGKIEIYSMGQNQGSTVKIALPVNYLTLNIS